MDTSAVRLILENDYGKSEPSVEFYLKYDDFTGVLLEPSKVKYNF